MRKVFLMSLLFVSFVFTSEVMADRRSDARELQTLIQRLDNMRNYGSFKENGFNDSQVRKWMREVETLPRSSDRSIASLAKSLKKTGQNIASGNGGYRVSS